MKKILLLFLLFYFAIACNVLAQTTNNVQISDAGLKASPGKHLIIAKLRKAQGVGLFFEYGQRPEKGQSDFDITKLVDSENHNIDAPYYQTYINYLLKLGWTLYGGISEDYCFFYKEVSTESEITEGLNFKKPPKLPLIF